MMTHTRNSCSAFTHPKCTHTTVNSHEAVGSHLCCGARGAVGGSVPCSRAPQSWYRMWRERCTFTSPTYKSGWPETPTPQSFDYESDSLTIRPRLPHLTNIYIKWFSNIKTCTTIVQLMSASVLFSKYPRKSPVTIVTVTEVYIS